MIPFVFHEWESSALEGGLSVPFMPNAHYLGVQWHLLVGVQWHLLVGVQWHLLSGGAAAPVFMWVS